MIKGIGLVKTCTNLLNGCFTDFQFIQFAERRFAISMTCSDVRLSSVNLCQGTRRARVSQQTSICAFFHRYRQFSRNTPNRVKSSYLFTEEVNYSQCKV